jgi:DNA-binding response OmpR family regulator
MTGKLLIVDDSPVILNVLAEILENASEYQLFTASTGSEALEIAQREHPDVLLLDVVLPDMDGFAVIERLKSNELLSDIYVIFLSGTLLRPEDKVRGLDLGAYDYLLKPVDPRELVSRVNVGFRMKQAEKILLDGVNLAFRTFRHELNNPLQALLLNLELAEKQTAPSEVKLKHRLSRIRECAERINATLRDSNELHQVQTTKTLEGEVLLLPSSSGI